MARRILCLDQSPSTSYLAVAANIPHIPDRFLESDALAGLKRDVLVRVFGMVGKPYAAAL